MVTVDPRLGEIPLRCSTPGLVAVDYRHYLEISDPLASFGVNGCVPFSSDEAIAYEGAT